MREIALNRGYVALVDDEDFDRVREVGRWFVAFQKVSSTGVITKYAQTCKRRKTTLMHRFILSPEKGLVVDHKNHDGLDNRRGNLRICTNQQNSVNRSKRAGSTSQYMGVFFHKHAGKWTASVRDSYMGLFESEIEAALAYDKAAREAYGEFAPLNFPEIQPAALAS